MTVSQQQQHADAAPLAVRRQVRVVGIGGTSQPGSSAEKLLVRTLERAAAAGARTSLFGSAELDLPPYDPLSSERTPATVRLVEAVSRADALVIAAPGYHGDDAGMVRNALEYLEDLRASSRPLLEGRVVGCIVCADGERATVTTLTALRATVHALRGWPTPIGLTVNTALHDVEDASDEALSQRIDLLVGQLIEFTRRWSKTPAPTAADQ